MNKKNLLTIGAAVVMIAALCVPVFASAQTSTIATLQAQITALLSQLAGLRSQLGAAIASSTPPGGDHGDMGQGGNASSTGMGPQVCFTFPRDLSQGSSGDDVRDLQQMLSGDPSIFSSSSITGFFGPLTAHALVEFQQKNNIASSSAGFFGPLTRNFFMKHCIQAPGPVHIPTSTMPWVGSSTWNGSSTHDGSSTPPHFPPPPIILNGSSTWNVSGTPPHPEHPPGPPMPPTPVITTVIVTSTTGY